MLIEDLTRSGYNSIEHRQKSTKMYPIFFQSEAKKDAPKFLVDSRNNTFVDTTMMKKVDVIQFVQTNEN